MKNTISIFDFGITSLVAKDPVLVKVIDKQVQSWQQAGERVNGGGHVNA